jgi:hypothetical protein
MLVILVRVLLFMFQQPAPPEAPKPPPPEPPVQARRTELNLLGGTDSSAGESRRNENVQFNLIDNNALKFLKIRLGTSASIVTEFRARALHGASFTRSDSIFLTALIFPGRQRPACPRGRLQLHRRHRNLAPSAPRHGR